MAKRIKLTDVAKAAGVSTSTVDRVLNSREGVRANTVARVHKALTELGYSASSVAAAQMGRPLNLVAILPKNPTSFMQKVGMNLERATNASTDPVSIEIRELDVLDEVAASDALFDLLKEEPDGVILYSVDTAEVREAIDALENSGIPVVTLVSDLPQSNRSKYIGIDNFSAGQTAGSLMSRFLCNRKGSVGMVIGHLGLRDHLERRSGFEQAMAAGAPNAQVKTTAATRDDSAATGRAARDLLINEPDLVGMYVIGGGNDSVYDALRDAGRQDLIVIGHELTGITRRCLVSGAYDAVVAQDYWVETEHAVKTLISINRKDGRHADLPRISIDIFMKENLP